MYYLSQLLGTPVEDAQGTRVGKIVDIVTTIGAHSAAPSQQVVPSASEFAVPSSLPTFVFEDMEDRRWYVPVHAVTWHDHILRLRTSLEELSRQPAPPPPQEVSLAQEVLDKQVIDIEHKKAVRVNDVCLGNDWRIIGIDNSTLGLVRRLAPAWLLGARSKRTPAALIPWERIELIGALPVVEEAPEATREATALKMQRPLSGQLAELRPADIADIVHQLTPGQGARLLEGLDDETAAETLEEIDTDRQSHILENINTERAADILDAMNPDEAADLLARLPEERAEELLRLMNPEESEEVQELLEYEEDTAGGLMTTDYVVINVTRSAGEALDVVRANIREDIRVAYVYCVEDETREECALLGVVSIWDLLAAHPAQLLQDVMETDLVRVQPDTDPREVAEIMAKYNLLAVPVVSENGILEGIVTVDDALDVLLPEERKRKPTRMY